VQPRAATTTDYWPRSGTTTRPRRPRTPSLATDDLHRTNEVPTSTAGGLTRPRGLSAHPHESATDGVSRSRRLLRCAESAAWPPPRSASQPRLRFGVCDASLTRLAGADPETVW